MKILFWGTPEIAVPFLEVCGRDAELVAVVTQPDRPAGRGLRLQSSSVKRAAERLNIPVLQPEGPGAVVDTLRGLGADLSVVVGYGKILRPQVLATARLGFLNVHFSLLPRYRGAAPIAWALIRGETRTGVTLFWLDEGMDTGPVQSRAEVEVGCEEDAVGLRGRLTQLGCELLRQGIADIGEGRIRRQPQAGEPSYAPKLTRQQARLDFSMPASEIHARVRGLRSGPHAFFETSRGSVALLKTVLAGQAADQGPNVSAGVGLEGAGPAASGTLAPGAIWGAIVRVERRKGVLVQCEGGQIWIVDVQPEGKRQISAVDFVNGLRLKATDLLFS